VGAYNIYRDYLLTTYDLVCETWDKLDYSEKEAWEWVEKELRGVAK
jgi:hypothetical protein